VDRDVVGILADPRARTRRARRARRYAPCMRRVVVFALFAVTVAVPTGSAFALPLDFPGPVEVPAGLIVHADLLLAMKPSASPRQLERAVRELRGRDDVIRYAVVTGKERRDQLVGLSDSPSLRRFFARQKYGSELIIDLAHDADVADGRSALERLPGVGEVVPDVPSGPTDVVFRIPPCDDLGYEAVVVMQVDATPIQIDAVAGAIGTQPDMRLVRHDDAAAALQQFRADHPTGFADVTEAHLADTLEIQLAPGSMTSALDGFEQLAGVEGVVSSRHGCDRLAAHRYRLP
jgi:hypothetical protein